MRISRKRISTRPRPAGSHSRGTKRWRSPRKWLRSRNRKRKRLKLKSQKQSRRKSLPARILKQGRADDGRIDPFLIVAMDRLDRLPVMREQKRREGRQRRADREIKRKTLFLR